MYTPSDFCDDMVAGRRSACEQEPGPAATTGVLCVCTKCMTYTCNHAVTHRVQKSSEQQQASIARTLRSSDVASGTAICPANHGWVACDIALGGPRDGLPCCVSQPSGRAFSFCLTVFSHKSERVWQATTMPTPPQPRALDRAPLQIRVL